MSSSHLPSWAQDALEDYKAKIDYILRLETALNASHLPAERDASFAESLCTQFRQSYSLSPRQWEWVNTLLERAYGSEPLYGDFKAVLVMFRIAGERLKKPKIRLMSDDNIFVQLTFNPEKPSVIEIHRDGWQGHGKRKLAGWIYEEQIVPYKSDRFTEGMKSVIQDFSLDPKRVSLAMAKRIGACMYCGSRLTDDTSKAVGYGPICAETYELPWGDYDPEASEKLLQSFTNSNQRSASVG